MNPDVIRVELGGGGWWDIKAFLSRADRKKVNRLERTWVKTRDDLSAEEIAKDPRAALILDPANADTDARDDLLLELGTVGWSYEAVFCMEAVDQLPDETVDVVLARMTELYLKKEAELAKTLKKA